jgi:hypothetical protein
MEALSRMMSATVESGLLSRFSVGSRNQEEMIVSHLLFANDTLLFCEPSVDNSETSNACCFVLKRYQG